MPHHIHDKDIAGAEERYCPRSHASRPSGVRQINCKLYAFNKESCWWQERGRGLLRLNDRRRDSGPLHSRLVFRTQGSLRLVLNTKVAALPQSVPVVLCRQVFCVVSRSTCSIHLCVAFTCLDDNCNVVYCGGRSISPMFDY